MRLCGATQHMDARLITTRWQRFSPPRFSLRATAPAGKRAGMTLRVHILTDVPARFFTRHAPGNKAKLGGVAFTFGLSLPQDADAVIVYARSRWTLPTHLPKARTAFVAGEPEEIHPYATRFLNQFGLVVASVEKELQSERFYQTPPLTWFVGLNFEEPVPPLTLDDIANWEMPEKDDRISIVTSRKATTPYQKQRLKLIDHLKEAIPNRIVLYGREFNPVSDKKDALLPHRYHLALENTGAKWSWTEKLSDPLLCWALPFYVGCSNAETELPPDAIYRIDPTDPADAVKKMVTAIDAGLWQTRLTALQEARRVLFTEQNVMALFARIAQRLCGQPDAAPAVTLRSEKSLPPEPGCRGSWPEMMLRRAALSVDPHLELRLARRKARRAGH